MGMTRGEGSDEEKDGAGGLRAYGAGAKSTEGNDGNNDGEGGEKGDAGGVLRAYGADDGGLENKDREEGDEDSENGGAGGVLCGQTAWSRPDAPTDSPHISPSPPSTYCVQSASVIMFRHGSLS